MRRMLLWFVLFLMAAAPAAFSDNAGSFRVAWKNLSTGTVHHGTWGPRSAIFAVARLESAHSLNFHYWVEEKRRILGFLPTRPRRIHLIHWFHSTEGMLLGDFVVYRLPNDPAGKFREGTIKDIPGSETLTLNTGRTIPIACVLGHHKKSPR